MTQIEQYALAWHIQTGGSYRVKLANSGWTNWIAVSAADLAALVAIFKEQPVYLHPNGAISTGAEAVSER